MRRKHEAAGARHLVAERVQHAKLVLAWWTRRLAGV